MSWAARLLHESTEWEVSSFVTLTYDDKNLPGDFGLSKRDLQLFLKRLRKNINRKIKYFACGEYGEEFGRPHYHLIMFGIGQKDVEVIEDSWDKGFSLVKPMNFGRIKYVTGYVLKKQMGKGAEVYGSRQAPFQLQSQGLGAQYVERNKEELIKNLSFTISGIKNALPRYYKDKLGDAVDKIRWDVESMEAQNKIIADLQSQGLSLAEISSELVRARQQKAKNLEARQNLAKRHN